MKILIVSLSNLGDAILTYPALQALWTAYPEAEFHILASPRTQALFEGEPRIHQVWLWEKKASILKQLRLIRALAKLKFQLVVDFRNSLIPFLIPGAKRTRLTGRSNAQNGTPIHRAQAHLKLVTDLKIPARPMATPLPWGAAEEKVVSKWLGPQRPVVVMVPGARSHLKRWKSQGFAEVADRLVREQQVQVVLVGSADEQPIAQSVEEAMAEPVINLVGQTNLRELAALMRQAALVITNDSASLHAADAMGAPTLALFGPTDEKKYGPRGAHSRVIRRRLTCSPCEKALCAYEHECMNWIEADEVAQAALEMLGHS